MHSNEIVGEQFHDHEIHVVRNLTYESLWDNLGMSDINKNKSINHNFDLSFNLSECAIIMSA